MAKFRSSLRQGGLRDASARQEFRALHRLPRDLSRLLGPALEASSSTGCTVWELERLHRSFIVRRPERAIEFGSGISTMVIAHAVRELARAGHVTRFVSMEQDRYYQEDMLEWFPADLREWADLRLSELVSAERSSGMTGYRYADTPDEQFDWVFVDGPELPMNDPMQFDADVLFLPRHRAMMVHVDARRATVDALVRELRPSRIESFPVHKWTTLHLEPWPSVATAS